MRPGLGNGISLCPGLTIIKVVIPVSCIQGMGLELGIDPALLNASKQIALFLVPFPFISPLFLLFPSPPYYTDLATPFPLPNWILVTENIIFSFLYPLGELLKEAITM